MLNQVLTEWEEKYGITAQSDLPGLRFRQIIDAAYEATGRKVVVLIDEYGKPYAELCGISEAELQEYFDESIAIMADEHKISKRDQSAQTVQNRN